MNKTRVLKRCFATIMVITMAMLTGCGKEETAISNTPADSTIIDGQLRIAASCFPIYALTCMITDNVDGIEVTCITQPSDECLRSYELSDWDAAVIASSDAIVIDGALENYSSSLYQMGESGPAVICADYELPLLTHTNVLNISEASSHYKDATPFAYLHTEYAERMLQMIAAGLEILDPDHTDSYSKNLEIAQEKIHKLHTDLEKNKLSVSGKKAIVMNEALLYPCTELGLVVEAEYARESGESLYNEHLDECLRALLACESRNIVIEQQVPLSLKNALEAAGFKVITLSTMSETPSSNGSSGWEDHIRNNANRLLKGLSDQ